MGINHFGHFLLNYYLWPEIKTAKNPRIVTTSSIGHYSNAKYANINFDDFSYET